MGVPFSTEVANAVRPAGHARLPVAGHRQDATPIRSHSLSSPRPRRPLIPRENGVTAATRARPTPVLETGLPTARQAISTSATSRAATRPVRARTHRLGPPSEPSKRDVPFDELGAQGSGDHRDGRAKGVVLKARWEFKGVAPCRNRCQVCVFSGSWIRARAFEGAPNFDAPAVRAASTASRTSGIVAAPDEMMSGRPFLRRTRSAGCLTTSRDAILYATGSNSSRKSTADASNGLLKGSTPSSRERVNPSSCQAHGVCASA